MTAIPRRRRRSTWLAFAVAILSLAATGALGLLGVRTLANSTEGQRASVADVVEPTQRLPMTATALVGVVDDARRLTSTAVFALEPDGTGGSIISFAASADAGSGTTGQLVPLVAAFDQGGPEEYVIEAERLTGLSFDVLEVVDQRRLTSLISPLGDLTVVLPVGVHDASTGEQWEAGEITLSSGEAVRILTAGDPSIADWYFEPARNAVWAAIADRVGAGIGSADPVERDEDLPPIGSLDEFVDRLYAGPVTARAPSFRSIDEQRVDDELADGLDGAFERGASIDVVAHDRAETLMLLGAVAPARLGAPLEAPTVRVVSGFDDDDLEPLGMRHADLLKYVLDRLLFAQVNIVSVAEVRGADTPERTVYRVDEERLVEGIAESYGDLFGEVDVVPAEVAIQGVDIEIVLGRSALDAFAAS